METAASSPEANAILLKLRSLAKLPGPAAELCDLAQSAARLTLSEADRLLLLHMIRVLAVNAMRDARFRDVTRLIDALDPLAENNADLRRLRARAFLMQRNVPACLADLAAVLSAHPCDKDTVNLLALLPDSAERNRLMERSIAGICAQTPANDQDARAAAQMLIRLQGYAEARALCDRQGEPGSLPAEWLETRWDLALATHDLDVMQACWQAMLASGRKESATDLMARDIAVLQGDRAALEPLNRRIGLRDAADRGDPTAYLCAALATGDYRTGFEVIYRSATRRKIAGLLDNLLPEDAPLATLSGKRVLILGYTELGDEIRLVDLVDRLSPRLAACCLAIDRRLATLVGRGRPQLEIAAIDKTATDAAGIPAMLFPHVDAATWNRRHAFDHVILLRDLEYLMVRGVDDLPVRRQVLHADPPRIAHWRAWLARFGPLPKAGLFWRSSRSNFRRANRITSLTDWQDITGLQGLSFFNLQFGEGVAREIEQVNAGGKPRLHIPPALDTMNDIDELAALLSALDLVVAVPGTTQHLAGALGVPVLSVTHPSQRLWRSRPGTSLGVWSPSVTVISGPPQQGFAGSIRAAAGHLQNWLATSPPLVPVME